MVRAVAGDCQVASVSHLGSVLTVGFALSLFNLVAEQAESIDNPLHEAAKRGRCDCFSLGYAVLCTVKHTDLNYMV